ncbi:MAG: methyl-accepting chemotaxis protein [Deltaproteobacteria bacterium]|nr:methyl-accepting chemotaxis protein [Deltaproteobacteria bacterium]
MLASRAEQTTEDTRGTRAKAEEGREVVSKTVECIKKVAEYAERTAQSMLDLGVQADGINNIVELIKDIADQTNLLALNAAIEAARAGESGRGFAVVADEVRKLAEKTMHATEDVNKSISALQAEVSVNKELTEQTVNLTRTATNFAEQSGKSLEAIVDIADHAVEAVQFISAETVEQSRSGSAIVEAVRNISDMARETTQNMAESARFVTDLSAQSENLKKLVEAMGSDRRRSERFAPDYLCRATIMGLGDKPCLCRITDISTIGVRVELQEKLQEDDQGEAFVYVRSDEASLKDLLKNVPGKRIWRDGDFMGIEFESPLKANPAEFAQMLQSSGRAW